MAPTAPAAPEDERADEDPSLADCGLFDEPEGYFPPEKPATTHTVTLTSGQVLSLRLVGHNPLWGHLLWNAGRDLTAYIETEATQLVQARSVLELGAGAGLPSLVCALRGAERVVVTDYPDAQLIENLEYNIQTCAPNERIQAQGYVWGGDVNPLLGSTAGFDVILLADTLFNHATHASQLQTLTSALRPAGTALVFFTPHRPHLLQADLAFFALMHATTRLRARLVYEKWHDTAMFETAAADTPAHGASGGDTTNGTSDGATAAGNSEEGTHKWEGRRHVIDDNPAAAAELEVRVASVMSRWMDPAAEATGEVRVEVEADAGGEDVGACGDKGESKGEGTREAAVDIVPGLLAGCQWVRGCDVRRVVWGFQVRWTDDAS